MAKGIVFVAVAAMCCIRESVRASNSTCTENELSKCLSADLLMVLPPASGTKKPDELAAHVAAVVSGSAASPSTVKVSDVRVGDDIMGYTAKQEAAMCTVLAVDQWTTGEYLEGGYTDAHMVLSGLAADVTSNQEWRTRPYGEISRANDAKFLYKKASPGSNVCPSGYSVIMSKDHCLKAAVAVGSSATKDQYSKPTEWGSTYYLDFRNIPTTSSEKQSRGCIETFTPEGYFKENPMLEVNTHATGGAFDVVAWNKFNNEAVGTATVQAKLCMKLPGTENFEKLVPRGTGALYELVTTCPVVVDVNGVLATITNTAVGRDLNSAVVSQGLAKRFSDAGTADPAGPLGMFASNKDQFAALKRAAGEALWRTQYATTWTDYLSMYDAFVSLIAKTGTFWLNPLAWTEDEGVDKLLGKKGTPAAIASIAAASYADCEREVLGDGAGIACQFFEALVVEVVLPSLTAEHSTAVTSAFPGLLQAPGDITHAGSVASHVVSISAGKPRATSTKTTTTAEPATTKVAASPLESTKTTTTAEPETTKVAASPLETYHPGDVGYLGSSPSAIHRVQGLSFEQCASLCSAWPKSQFGQGPERQRRGGDVDGYTPAGEGFVRGGNVKYLAGDVAATLQSCRDACNGKGDECVAFHFSKTKKVCGLKSHAATKATMENKLNWQKGYQAYNKGTAAPETEEPPCRAFQYDAKNKKCGLEKYRRYYEDGRSELYRTKPWHLNFRVYNSKPEMASDP